MRINPEHYEGNGVSCADVMRSMLTAAEEKLSAMQIFWWANAFKYVWRWPLKNGVEDIDKAVDCLEKLKELGQMEEKKSDGMVNRPLPKPVGADGQPIEVGDTVYFTDETGRAIDRACKVLEISYDGILSLKSSDALPTFAASPEHYTHEQPDTLERIEEDAVKGAYAYWGCEGIPCSGCPAKIGGKTPKERYDTLDCGDAHKLDLLRRQREVLERELRHE